INVARTLNTTLESAELLARMNRAALEHLKADWSATFLIDGDRNSFRIAALSDLEIRGSDLGRVEFPVDSWPVVHRLAHERVLALSGADMEQVSSLLTGNRRFSAILLAGLYQDRSCIGMLALGYELDTSPPTAMLQQLAAIADHAAVALRN